MLIMQMWFNGRIPPSQGGDAGPIPVICSISGSVRPFGLDYDKYQFGRIDFFCFMKSTKGSWGVDKMVNAIKKRNYYQLLLIDVKNNWFWKEILSLWRIVSDLW